jgi:Tannase and feruloyl esterase
MKVGLARLMTVGLAIGIAASSASAAAAECADLALMQLTDLEFGRPIAALKATIVQAEGNIPAHCQLEGTIWPETKYMLKLPLDGWNGRFVMTGNGGPAGAVRTPLIAGFLRNGYAAAGDSGGHTGDRPLFSFAYNPPDNSNPHARQKLVDFAYRSIHESTHLSRKLIQEFYGRAPLYSYFVGNSQGGRQGLKNAQKYPGDFDGWVIGYPVLNITDETMHLAWNARAVVTGPGALPATKLPALVAAATRKCDALDGVTDSLISEPRKCTFAPSQDLPRCSAAGDDDSCFTAAQIEGLNKVYGGPTDSTGKAFYFSVPVGSEVMAPVPGADGNQLRSLWMGILLPTDPGNLMSSTSVAYGDSYVRHVVLQSPEWDWKTAPLSPDDYHARARGAGIYDIVDALDPDLRKVAEGGKKILHYHGWADALVTPYVSADYFNRVTAALGPEKASSFYRLYMVPGMGHGPSAGPAYSDWLETMRAWVEEGKAPDAIVATRPAAQGRPAMSRPLCPYPEIARYQGRGDINDAASFACVVPGG